jgi:hypothetical protein
MMPRRINTPADYWPQKVLAVSSVNPAMQNYVSIYEHQKAIPRVFAKRMVPETPYLSGVYGGVEQAVLAARH